MSDNHRLIFDIIGRKGNQMDFVGSLQTQVSYRIKKNGNQYISLQWYFGYAESLIDYTKSVNMVRIGMIIKPQKFVFY